MQHVNMGQLMNYGPAILTNSESPLQVVMKVLHDIRTLQSDGRPYDKDSNLTDAGFTSVEMVKVMLGIEAAFDVMIPQEMITPENFTSGATISKMVETLYAQG